MTVPTRPCCWAIVLSTASASATAMATGWSFSATSARAQRARGRGRNLVASYVVRHGRDGVGRALLDGCPWGDQLRCLPGHGQRQRNELPNRRDGHQLYRHRVTDGTTYYYTVAAVNSSGTQQPIERSLGHAHGDVELADHHDHLSRAHLGRQPGRLQRDHLGHRGDRNRHLHGGAWFAAGVVARQPRAP